MTDEHGAQFSGTYGHPFIATPAMDRLAAEGVTFDAAYCNNPLCVPSRLSFMTGQYTQRCRGWDNATPLAADALTWPHLLGAAGYDVALSGKMHLIGDDPLHGFQEQLARDLHIELQHPIFAWDDGVPEAREPWPGVVRTESRVPPGPGAEGHPAADEDAATPPTGPGRSPEIDADDEAVDAALAYLRARAHGPDARPFALCVGLIAPHFPFVVPEPFFSQYFPHHADLPALPDGHLDTLPPAARRLRRAFGFHGHTDAQVRRARAAYYGLVSYADDKLRQLLDALDECGLVDDTVVIHTSDHGEMLGEHGLWRKMSFYEQSARVPPADSLAGLRRGGAPGGRVCIPGGRGSHYRGGRGRGVAGGADGRPQPGRFAGRPRPRVARRGVRRTHGARHRPGARHAAARALEAVPVRRRGPGTGTVRPGEGSRRIHQPGGRPRRGGCAGGHDRWPAAPLGLAAHRPRSACQPAPPATGSRGGIHGWWQAAVLSRP